MRLPQDPENWTPMHVEKSLAKAWKLFDKYEAKVNFDWPKEKQDELYRPYQLARQRTIEVVSQVFPNWFRRIDNMLP